MSDGTRLIAGERLVTPQEVWAPGWLEITGSRITGLGAGSGPREPIERLPPGSTIVPGLVDMHVHGAGGGNMTAPQPHEISTACRALLDVGVTATVVSLVTAPITELETSLNLIAAAQRSADHAMPIVLGAHLEGPFLAADHRGSHDTAELRQPDLSLLRRLLDAGQDSVRMVTLAPELPGADALIADLMDQGVVVAMGHTGATYIETKRAVDRGVRVGTHLFNGMRRPHHREPGPALTLLDDDRVVVELIYDTVHVHPVVARTIARVAGAGRLALISDGVAATGAPDGDYLLGRVPIRQHHGRVETADGRSLGGGATTVDRSLRRAVEDLDLPLAAAVSAVTATPAAALGVAGQAGTLAAGRVADVVVLDRDLAVSGVMRAGEWIRHPSEQHQPADPRRELT